MVNKSSIRALHIGQIPAAIITPEPGMATGNGLFVDNQIIPIGAPDGCHILVETERPASHMPVLEQKTRQNRAAIRTQYPIGSSFAICELISAGGTEQAI